MTRVFPIEEWAPAKESPSSTSHLYAPSQDSHKANDFLSVFRFRNRQRSLPRGTDSDFSERFQNLSFGGNNEKASGKENTPENGKREGGIRGLLRRASVSIKSKSQRRHSNVTEELPSTSSSSWHKCRQAASFNRHSRVLSVPFDTEGPVDSCEELLSPVPGAGASPPIIPRGSGGAAARRTAAAQNEYFGRHRQLLIPAEDELGDRESGIGIALTTSEPAQYHDTDTSISRVDFVSLLPAELSIQILAHLDHRALCCTSRVSRSWAEISRSQHIWREAFVREKSKTYATSKPVAMGTGLGLPPLRPDNDWRDLYRIREQLEFNWTEGKAEPVYLNGHLDSIYCVQSDE
jgi:F-box and WD-40 domain protein 1/11